MATAGNDEKGGGSAAPRKAPAKATKGPAVPGGGGGPRRTGAKPAAGDTTADLRGALRLFASARPAGWDHRDWLSFLEELQSSGHDTSDADGIGRQLEQERLAVVLQQVPGLGPRRVDSLINRFGTLWSISHAGADEIAGVPGMNRPLAEKVRQALQR